MHINLTVYTPRTSVHDSMRLPAIIPWTDHHYQDTMFTYWPKFSFSPILRGISKTRRMFEFTLVRAQKLEDTIYYQYLILVVTPSLQSMFSHRWPSAQSDQPFYFNAWLVCYLIRAVRHKPKLEKSSNYAAQIFPQLFSLLFLESPHFCVSVIQSRLYHHSSTLQETMKFVKVLLLVLQHHAHIIPIAFQLPSVTYVALSSYLLTFFYRQYCPIIQYIFYLDSHLASISCIWTATIYNKYLAVFYSSKLLFYRHCMYLKACQGLKQRCLSVFWGFEINVFSSFWQ